MRPCHIAVIGAGITGLTQALCLQRQGSRITLFECGGGRLDHHCSYVGAGMLAPYCELSEAEAEIARWGVSALALWRQIVPTLAQPVHMTCEGTLVVAHHRDRAGMQHLAERAGNRFWSTIKELGVQVPAEYRRLQDREGSRDHRRDGAGNLRDGVAEAGSHR